MPAKNLSRVSSRGSYSHIYNKGVENRLLFKDDQDYQVFIEYLKAYLSPPQDPTAAKRQFTVKGKTYTGTPHQPKNYFRAVELISFCLRPDHFHLVLHQVEDSSVEKLIRSLCTRYSMYFNKKYNRTGALFNGPYRSVEIKEAYLLPLISSYLHDKAGNFTSLSEYANPQKNYWISPVEGGNVKFNANEEQKKILQGILHEDLNNHHIEEQKPQTQPTRIENNAKQISVAHKKPLRIPEILISFTIFVFLFGFGINNVEVSSAKDSEKVLGVISELPPRPSPTSIASATPIASVSATFRPRVLLVASDSANITTPKPLGGAGKQTLIVKIKDGSVNVNIRKEPSTTADKVGTAKENEIFEYLSYDPIGWYKIVLTDGTGYISTKYIEVRQNTN